jgi:hypothetical protein
MENIKVFKLINGEEIISKATETGTGWILNSPAQIVMQQTKEGVGVALAPYMPYASGEITMYQHAVTSEAKPDVKMENEYSRLFGSGIQIVSSTSSASIVV